MPTTNHKRSPMGFKSKKAFSEQPMRHKGSLSLRMKPVERYGESEVESSRVSKKGKRKTKSKKSRERVESKQSSTETVVSEESQLVPKRELSSDSKKKKRSKKKSKKKTKSKEYGYNWPPESEEVSPEEEDHLTHVSSKEGQKKKQTELINDKESKEEPTTARGSQEPWSDRRFSDNVPPMLTSKGIEERTPSRSPSSKVVFKEGSPSLHKVSSGGSQRIGSPSLHKVGSRGSTKKGSLSFRRVSSRESIKDRSSTSDNPTRSGSLKGSLSFRRVSSRESIKDRSSTSDNPTRSGTLKESPPPLDKVTSRGSLKDRPSTSDKNDKSGTLNKSSPPLHESDSKKKGEKDVKEKYRSMKVIFRDPRTKKETIVIIDDEDDGQVPTGQAFLPQKESPKQTALRTQDRPGHPECPSGSGEVVIRLHMDDKNDENSKQVQHPSTINKSTASETRSGRNMTEDRSSKYNSTRKSKKNGQSIRETGTNASKYPEEQTSRYTQFPSENMVNRSSMPSEAGSDRSGRNSRKPKKSRKTIRESGADESKYPDERTFKSTSSINKDTIHKNGSPTISESLQPEECGCSQNMEERGVNTAYNAHFATRFPPCFREVWHPSVNLANSHLYISNKHDQCKISNSYNSELRLNNLNLLKGRNDVNSDNSSECTFICIKHAYNRNLGHISDNHLILNENFYIKTINENVEREKKFIKNSKNKEEDTKLCEEICNSKKYKFDEHFENCKMLLPKQMSKLGIILPTKSSALIDAVDTVVQYSPTPDEFPPLPSGLLYYYSEESTSTQITDDLGKYNNKFNKKCPKKSFWKKMFTKIFHNKQFKQKNMGVQTF